MTVRNGFDPDGRRAEDRRFADRRAVMIPATIQIPGEEAIPCVLREMSAQGAKLSVSRRHRLPAAFTLTVPGRDYAVRRIWQREDFAGITLDLAPPEAAAP